jgi:hypothetical protein
VNVNDTRESTAESRAPPNPEMIIVIMSVDEENSHNRPGAKANFLVGLIHY